jgi:hypothetical protein
MGVSIKTSYYFWKVRRKDNVKESPLPLIACVCIRSLYTVWYFRFSIVLLSSGMWRRVIWYIITGVTDETAVWIFRVEVVAASVFPKTLITIYHCTWRHSPAERTVFRLLCENTEQDQCAATLKSALSHNSWHIGLKLQLLFLSTSSPHHIPFDVTQPHLLTGYSHCAINELHCSWVMHKLLFWEEQRSVGSMVPPFAAEHVAALAVCGTKWYLCAPEFVAILAVWGTTWGFSVTSNMLQL